MTKKVMDIENMRTATKEEMDAINKYIASISVDTGFNIWDLQEQVKVYDAYRNKGYTDGYNQALDDVDNIITERLDKSDNQVECQTLRWVLDVLSDLIK